MTDVAVTLETVERLLAPFESRPATLSIPEREELRRGIAFGWELNRIQGATRSKASERLAELVCTGRITRDEYRELSADLARRGLLGVDMPKNGR